MMENRWKLQGKSNMERACIAPGTMFFDLKSFGDDLRTCNNHFQNIFAYRNDDFKALLEKRDFACHAWALDL